MRPAVKNVLVTGGAGFLGTRIVQNYLSRGVTVRAVGRTRRTPQTAGFEFVGLDLCDFRRVVDVVSGQDLVIHAAAILSARSPEERALQERVNVGATENIIEACRRNGIRRLVHVSTTAAIGISSNPRAPADERFHFNLDDLGLSYHSSKHQAERLVLQANSGTLETVVVNPGFMFGSHQGGYRGGEVITRVLRRPVVICTDGGLSVVHLDDVVDGIRRAADHGRAGQRYILSGENVTYSAIARTICRLSGIKKMVISVPNVLRDLAGILVSRIAGADAHLYLCRRYAYQFYSSQKARAELSYQPRPLEAIVADYLNFCHPLRKRKRA
jgi:dihydroflavonol-4-reductase